MGVWLLVLRTLCVFDPNASVPWNAQNPLVVAIQNGDLELTQLPLKQAANWRSLDRDSLQYSDYADPDGRIQKCLQPYIPTP